MGKPDFPDELFIAHRIGQIIQGESGHVSGATLDRAREIMGEFEVKRKVTKEPKDG